MDFRALDPHLAFVDLCSRYASISASLCARTTKKPTPQNSALLWGSSREFIRTETEMAVGTVKWFNATKGYGFIQPEDGGKDVFVHITAVERSELNGLNEGQRLSYELEKDRRTGKESAVNLKNA